MSIGNEGILGMQRIFGFDGKCQKKQVIKNCVCGWAWVFVVFPFLFGAAIEMQQIHHSFLRKNTKGNVQSCSHMYALFLWLFLREGEEME